MSVTDSLASPSLDRSLYTESVVPKRRLVGCPQFHLCISACRIPRLRSGIRLHLLHLVLGARIVSELRGAHTHGCPGAVYQLIRQSPGQLDSISPSLSASLCESTVPHWKTYRRTSLSPTKDVHSSHGIINFAKTPWPLSLTRLLIVCLSLVILIQDIIFIEFEERLDLCHHPGQCDIGFTLIGISATNILMYAREPNLRHLYQLGELGSWQRPLTCLKLVVLLRGFAHTLGCRILALLRGRRVGRRELLPRRRHDVHPAPALGKRFEYNYSSSYRRRDILLWTSSANAVFRAMGCVVYLTSPQYRILRPL